MSKYKLIEEILKRSQSNICDIAIEKDEAAALRYLEQQAPVKH